MVRGGSRHCASKALGSKATKAKARRSFRIITGALCSLPSFFQDESITDKLSPKFSNERLS
jgi:hypothetical protein